MSLLIYIICLRVGTVQVNAFLPTRPISKQQGCLVVKFKSRSLIRMVEA